MSERERRMRLRAYGGRFDRHAARPFHQVELERDVFGGSVAERLSAYARDAIAEAALQRSRRLPFEPIQRVSGRMRLRDRRGGQMPASMLVVAFRAGEIQLAHALREER